jgi:hypothetical protein
MRKTLLIGFATVSAACALALFNIGPAGAAGSAVCSQNASDNVTRCDYATLSQCRTDQSGRGGTCIVNTGSSFASMRRPHAFR